MFILTTVYCWSSKGQVCFPTSQLQPIPLHSKFFFFKGRKKKKDQRLFSQSTKNNIKSRERMKLPLDLSGFSPLFLHPTMNAEYKLTGFDLSGLLVCSPHRRAALNSRSRPAALPQDEISALWRTMKREDTGFKISRELLGTPGGQG